MNPKCRLTVAAALAAGLAAASPALGQLLITEVPAVSRGRFLTCTAQFPRSFLDIGTQACWECPTTHPARTVFPVMGGNACERPAYEAFKKASGPENPTGLIRTDCRSGWFLDVGKGKCYSCAGYNRSAYPIDHARACSKAMPVLRTRATRKGVESCPAGGFRNGLTADCYACPADYSRNAVIANDLTKVNACSRISTAVRDATLAKYEQHKNDHPASRANMARAVVPAAAPAAAPAAPAAAAPAAKVPDGGVVVRYPEDSARQAQMEAILDDELERESGFVVVSWMRTSGGSLLVGYTRGEGYAMTKVDTAYKCRTVKSDAFTAGISAGAGVSEELGLSQSPLDSGKSETNGVQVAAALGLTLSHGWHWDASTRKHSLTRSLAADATPSRSTSVKISVEYVHTWEDTGDLVACNNMTWGKPEVTAS